jgi:hypothetical protein
VPSVPPVRVSARRCASVRGDVRAHAQEFAEPWKIAAVRLPLTEQGRSLIDDCCSST